jgi:mono/diheme cytochrome c family protein
MKKSILFFATFLMFHYFINAQSDPDWNWESKLESDCSIDNDGHLDIKDVTANYEIPNQQFPPYVYVVGKFNGTITLNGRTLSSTDACGGTGYDGFLAQYDFSGNLQWITTFGKSANDEEAGMAVVSDLAGNVYLTGYILPYDVGGNLHIKMGNNLLTTTSVSSTLPGSTAAVGGYVTANVPWSQQTVPYVAKFDRNGTIQWLEVVSAPDGRGLGIALSPANDGSGLNPNTSDGDLYVTGYFKEFLGSCGACHSPTTGSFTSTNSEKTFVIKYKTAAGIRTWQNYINNDVLNASTFNVGRGITVEDDFIDPFTQQRTADQDVYIVGEYRGDAKVDHTSSGLPRKLPAPLQIDGYIAKLDHTNGDFIWETRVYSSGDDWVKEADMFAARSELYIIGDYPGNSTLTLTDPTGTNTTVTTSGTGSGDVFVGRYDWNGNPVWATTLASSGADYGTDIIAFKQTTTDLHIAGIYSGDLSDDFNQTLKLGGSGDPDHFIAKLDRSNGFTEWAEGIDASWDDATSRGYFYSRPRITYEYGDPDEIFMSGAFKSTQNPVFTNQLSTNQSIASYVAERNTCNCPTADNINIDRSDPFNAVVTWDDPDFATCIIEYVVEYTNQATMVTNQTAPFTISGGGYNTVINTTSDVYEWRIVTNCTNGQENGNSTFLKNGKESKAYSEVIISEGLAKDEKVEVYPNPVTNTLFISGEFAKGTDGLQSVEVMDILGKVVKTETIEGSAIKNYQLELGGLKTGIYIVKIKSTNHTHSFKITKE